MKKKVKGENDNVDFKKYINVYEFEVTLPGSGEVIKFKPITTHQMKNLLMYENENDPGEIEKALDEFITSCVVSKDFDVKSLYLQDRFFLLVEIRKQSRGSTYKVEFKCPECSSQNLVILDLGTLKLTQLDPNLNKKVELSDKVSIELDFLKRGDMINAYDMTSKKKEFSELRKAVEVANISYAMAIRSITTPDGVQDNLSLDDKLYIVDNISQGIFESVRDWFEKNTFGIDFTFKMKCRHMKDDDKPCTYNDVLEIPLDNFFS